MALKYRILGFGTIALLLAAVALALLGRPTLSIRAKEFPLAGGVNRHYYLATIGNWTTHLITLEAIKNEDERSGGGHFFPCEIAARDQASRHWSTITNGSLAEEQSAAPGLTLTVIPFERVNVCDTVLPLEGEPAIDCVRITLHTHWQSHFDQQDQIASKVIPVANSNSTTPCTE
jgi:hypothetical protein